MLAPSPNAWRSMLETLDYPETQDSGLTQKYIGILVGIAAVFFGIGAVSATMWQYLG